jgi:hypothetical protein
LNLNFIVFPPQASHCICCLTGSDDYLDGLALAHWEALGQIPELHPPEELSTFGFDKKKIDKLYNGMYAPGRYGNRLSLGHDEIASGGEAPKWLAQNCLKSPEFCLYSLGELSFHAAITTNQLMNHLGRDAVLQHCWMRWVLAINRDNVEEILKVGSFPAIPAWPVIKRKLVAAANVGEIVKFTSLSSPYELPEYETYTNGNVYVRCSGFVGFFPPDMLVPRSSKATMPACLPWTAPDPRWGAFPEGHDFHEWREQKHSELIEKIFTRGGAEKYAAEKRRKQVSKMQSQMTPEQKEESAEQMKNHTFSGSRW